MVSTFSSSSSRTKLLAILLGSLLLTSCAASDGGQHGSTPPTEGKLTTVNVGIIPVAEFAPVYIAQDEGYFEAEGLDVKTQVIQNAASIAPSVLNGQLQFGTAAAFPFLSAMAKGLPLTAVANASSVSPDADEDPSAILVMPDRGFKSTADLAGKIVAVNALGSASHVTAAANIEQDGGDHTKTTFVAMPFPDMIAALERGTIDAAVVVEPFQVQGVENGAVVLSHPNSKTLTPGTFTVVFASQQFAAKNPDTVAKFQRAMNKASLAAAKDPSVVAKVLEKHLNLDPGLFDRMRVPLYSDDLSTKSLQHMADLMVDLGFMEKTIDASKSVWAPAK